MDKILARLNEARREPSTYAGLASVVAGVGQLAKINEAPGVADALINIGTAVATGGASSLPSFLLVVFGAIAMAFREKGAR